MKNLQNEGSTLEEKNAIDSIILGMQDLTRVLWAAAALLAPWIVPVGSAIFFGLAMYGVAIKLNAPEWLAYIVGISVAVGLETVNIGTAHSTMALSHHREEHKWKFALAILLMVFYVALGVGATFTLPLDRATHILAASLFFLTPVAIISQALTLDLATTTQEAEKEAQIERETEVEDITHQRELEARKLEMEHEARLKEAELAAQYKTSLGQARWDARAKIASVQVTAQATGDRSNERPLSDQDGGGRSNGRPEWAGKWATKAAFLFDVETDEDLRQAVHNMSGADFARMTGKPNSSSRRWVAEAKEISPNGHQ
jgi:hypothetical protein